VWDALVIALSLDASMIPDDLRTPEGRRLRDPLPFIAASSRKHAAKELFETLGALGIATSLLQTPAQLLQNEHLRARGFFKTLDHPRLGRIAFPGAAGRLRADEFRVAGSEFHVPGACGHGEDWIPSVLQPLGNEDRGAVGANPSFPVQPPPPVQPQSGSPEAEHPAPPLAGVRVLDLTTAWIAPYATMLLADLGADVIKVESPRRPDVWRGYHGAGPNWPPRPAGARPEAHPWNVSYYFNSVNRNKRGLALDLASTAGKELFLRLVRDADLLIENFTPRVMENFGLSYGVLRGVNPRLVMVSFSG
jgi:crotonobetainyl-CoA:carnitine CoA-transferase CaiB-like acyl-CoA transferase